MKKILNGFFSKKNNQNVEPAANLTINELPNEILSKILGYAENPQQLLQQATVAKKWNDLIHDNQVWKNLGYENYATYKENYANAKKPLVKIALFSNVKNFKSEILQLVGTETQHGTDFKNVSYKGRKLQLIDSLFLSSHPNSFEAYSKQANILLFCVNTEQELQLLLNKYERRNILSNDLLICVVASTASDSAAIKTIVENYPMRQSDKIDFFIYEPTQEKTDELIKQIVEAWQTIENQSEAAASMEDIESAASASFTR